MPSQQHRRAEARKRRRAEDLAERHVVGTARVRFCRVSARKARLVGDLIRGLAVAEALNVLRFTHRPSSKPIVERLLKSAVANAEQKGRSDTGSLVVGRIWVDGGPMLKRFRPRAYGRASPIRKRMCHISMEIMEA